MQRFHGVFALAALLVVALTLPLTGQGLGASDRPGEIELLTAAGPFLVLESQGTNYDVGMEWVQFDKLSINLERERIGQPIEIVIRGHGRLNLSAGGHRYELVFDGDGLSELKLPACATARPSG